MKPAWEGRGADQLVRDARGKGGAGVCVERSCDGGEARGRGAKRARAARARAHTHQHILLRPLPDGAAVQLGNHEIDLELARLLDRQVASGD